MYPPCPIARRRARLGAALVAVGAVVLASQREPAHARQAVIDPEVLAAVSNGQAMEVLLVLDERADLAPASSLASKPARGRFVLERLRDVAERSQASLRRELRERQIPFRPFWIANAIAVTVEANLLAELAARPEIRRIAANPRAALQPVTRALREGFEDPCEGPDPLWNLAAIGADTLWAQGAFGEGVTIGSADTGFAWQHEAIVDRYRGSGMAIPGHAYNWHDAIHVAAPGNPCGVDSAFPCDDNGHGTSTMSNAVGRSPVARLGPAPQAQWIGCRNMDRGVGTPATYLECFEFFLAPTDLGGGDPRPDLAPDIVTNSWRCPASEGCTDPGVLRDAVSALRAAGIFVVAAAGNDGGAGCGSLDAPPGIYEEVLTIGSSTLSGEVASSSRGPVVVDGSMRLKPDMLAPGNDVCVADADGGYTDGSGSSLATPHVAGLIAQLLSRQPCLRGQLELVEDHLRTNAHALLYNEDCPGYPGSVRPNTIEGWGVVHAPAGMLTCPLTPIFADGFESGDTGAWTAPP